MENENKIINLDKFKKRKKQVVSITLDEKIIEKLREQNVNVSRLINNLLKNLIDKM